MDNYFKILEEFKEITIFGDFPINSTLTSGKYCANFRESWDFFNRLLEVLKVFWWNFGKIVSKFFGNLR